MSERLVITQGDDGPILESLWRGIPHNRNECPGCEGVRGSVMRVAIQKLVYSFEPCGCEEVGYSHLVERLWHPACYLLDQVSLHREIEKMLERAIVEAENR